MLATAWRLLVAAALAVTPAVPAAAAPDTTGYQVQGTAITGTSTPTAAPRLVPGQYIDALDRAGTTSSEDGSVHFYSLTLRTGDTPYVTATLVRPDGRSTDALTVEVELGVVEDGAIAGCSFDEQESSDSSDGRYDAATAVLTPGEVGGIDWPSQCPSGGTFTVAVTRIGDANAGQPARLELAVRVEPSADAAGVAAAATAAADNVRPDPGSRLSAARGGSSYNDATALTSGTYRDSVVAGRTRYYRVRLAWGQRLAYTVTADRIAGTDGVRGGVALANPVRQVLEQAGSSNDSDFSLGTSSGPLYGSSAVPLRWTNRTSTDRQLRPYSVEGDFFLLVSTDLPDAGKPVPTISFTLQLGIVGAREPGPVYGPGRADATGVVQASTADDSSSPWTEILVAAGAVVFVAALGVAALVLRRRRVSPRAATRTFRT